METLELNCERRNLGTKGQVKTLRRSGRVPAIIYGPKTKPMPVSVPVANLKSTVTSDASQRLLKLKAPDPELDGRHVIVKDVQREPISGALMHADLYEVDLSAKLQVTVPLRFNGRPKGVADGGILQPLLRTIEVECLPTDIPEAVDVDVTELGIHEAIHISALQFGSNITPVYDTDIAIVTVLPPTVEEAPVAPVAEEAAPEAAPAEGAEAGEAPAPAAAPAEGGAAAKKPEGGKK